MNWEMMNDRDIEEYVEENMLLENGYLNMSMFLKIPVPFVVIIGPRGTGKTFGAYQEALKAQLPMFSVRRKRKQYDLMSNEFTTPIDKPYKMENVAYHIEKVEDGLSAVFVEGNKRPFVYLTYLGNIRDMRGFNADDLEIMLLDEGVPELGERKTSGEGVALLHAYETINRNRELEHRRPMKFLMLCNYDDAGCDIFVQLRIVTQLYKLKAGKCKYIRERGLLIFNTGETPVSREKEHTALYKLVGNESEFYKLAINNMSPKQFNETLSLPYKELELRFRIGECCVYWWKRGKKFYVAPNTHHNYDYDASARGVCKLKAMERQFIWDFAMGECVYESEFLEQVMSNYLHTKI